MRGEKREEKRERRERGEESWGEEGSRRLGGEVCVGFLVGGGIWVEVDCAWWHS